MLPRVIFKAKPLALFIIRAIFVAALPAIDENVQKRAAIAISGAFNRTAGETLDVLCYLQPIELALVQALADATLRLGSSANHKIMVEVQRLHW